MHFLAWVGPISQLLNDLMLKSNASMLRYYTKLYLAPHIQYWSNKYKHFTIYRTYEKDGPVVVGKFSWGNLEIQKFYVE